jgi:hypothetical protein
MTVSLLSSRRHVGSMTVLACVTWIPRSSTISGSGTRITLGLRRLAATRRRARRRGAVGFHTSDEWKALQAAHGGLCAYCRLRPGVTKDHIVPLSRGGSDWIENIAPACRSCNARKRDLSVRDFVNEYSADSHQNGGAGEVIFNDGSEYRVLANPRRPAPGREDDVCVPRCQFSKRHALRGFGVRLPPHNHGRAIRGDPDLPVRQCGHHPRARRASWPMRSGTDSRPRR